jgi:hypothetical protein
MAMDHRHSHHLVGLARGAWMWREGHPLNFQTKKTSHEN